MRRKRRVEREREREREKRERRGERRESREKSVKRHHCVTWFNREATSYVATLKCG